MFFKLFTFLEKRQEERKIRSLSLPLSFSPSVSVVSLLLPSCCCLLRKNKSALSLYLPLVLLKI